MLHTLLMFVILVIAFSIAWYAVNALIGDPQVKKILTVLLVVIAGIFVIWILMGMLGGDTHTFRIGTTLCPPLRSSPSPLS